LGNSQRLKTDLADLGVFDTKMSLYLLEKLREFGVMGFSGFEGRHYSLFESFTRDMEPAVNLQNLLYLLAFKYIVTSQIGHGHIPDDPSVESERRQVIFGAAIGIPTFFVRSDTGNVLLKKIIARTQRVRMSGRYPGYLRVYNFEYRRALLMTLREDAADLIEMLGMRASIDELETRLDDPKLNSTSSRLTRGILDTAGARSPLDLSADTFNQAAEKYYREDLRNRHIREAFGLLREDMEGLEDVSDDSKRDIQRMLNGILKERTAGEFLADAEQEVIRETASPATLAKMIQLVLVQIHDQTQCNRKHLDVKDG